MKKKRGKKIGGEEGADSSRVANIRKCSICQQIGHNKKNMQC